MKKHRHWIKIDGYQLGDEEKRQYKEIEKYLHVYPESRIEIYQYKHDLFNKVVMLECCQDYNNLDMDINSGSNRLRKLSQKPKNIEEMKNVTLKNSRLEII